MFRNSLPDRVMAGIAALEDPFDLESVVEVVANVSHSRATMLTALECITEAWDEVEVNHSEDQVNITIRLHVDYKVWTNSVHHVMFALMDEGFGWIDHLKSFELEFEYP